MACKHVNTVGNLYGQNSDSLFQHFKHNREKYCCLRHVCPSVWNTSTTTGRVGEKTHTLKYFFLVSTRMYHCRYYCYITRNALHWFLLPELRHAVLIRRKHLGEMLPILADAVGVIRNGIFLNLIDKLYHTEPYNWAPADVVLRAI